MPNDFYLFGYSSVQYGDYNENGVIKEGCIAMDLKFPNQRYRDKASWLSTSSM